MMIPANKGRLPLYLVITLWSAALAQPILAAAPTFPLIGQIEVIEKAADIAREKDVVWMSLAVAIAAIGATVWLAKKNMDMNQKLVDLARDGYKAIDDLRDELERQRGERK